jgi:hypothetical protein
MNQGQSARSDALEALIQYDQSSTSMKTLLREMQTASPDSPDSHFHTQSLSLAVVRFRNTIDFIISRSLGKRKLSELLSILKLNHIEVSSNEQYLSIWMRLLKECHLSIA